MDIDSFKKMIDSEPGCYLLSVTEKGIDLALYFEQVEINVAQNCMNFKSANRLLNRSDNNLLIKNIQEITKKESDLLGDLYHISTITDGIEKIIPIYHQIYKVYRTDSESN